MRRLARILLNAATAASLMLCMATVALWGRSHWALDTFDDFAEDNSRWSGVASFRGCVEVFDRRPTALHLGDRRRFDSDLPQDFDPLERWDDLALDPCWRWGRFGLARAHGLPPRGPLPYGVGTLTGWSVVVPDWALAGMFVTAPVMAVVRRRRGHCTPGLCPTCGYDLRASPDRCPECGTLRTGVMT